MVTARTDLQLVPGTRLRAHVHSEAAGFVLRLGERPADALASALARQGVVGDESAKLIARSLMATGLPVKAETVALLRRIMAGWPAHSATGRLTPSRLARSLANLLARGVDVASPGTKALVEQMNYDGERDQSSEDEGDSSSQQGSRRQRQEYQRQSDRRQRQAPQGRGVSGGAGSGDGGAAAVADGLRRQLAHGQPAAASTSAAPSALAVFNHLPDQSSDIGERWWVLPVAVRDERGATAVAGTLRLCFRNQLMIRALLDAAAVPTGDADTTAVRATFVLPIDAKAGPLRVVAEDAGSAALLMEALPALADKVRNLGFEVDDIVEEDPAYDGFSTAPGPPGYQPVDAFR